jgi:serine/threonine-protein kinase
VTEEEVDPLVAQCQQRVGAMLSGKWRLDALIGVGGMAAVYASSHRNGARAALKVLHAEFAGHQEVRGRFLREAYIANKVEHSGTVKVLDDDVSEGGEPYLVMELLTGESVESRASRNGGWLKYPEVLTIVEQTLAVLERAHLAGVVHRDLKPDNLFLTTKGELKVLDFGIARLHDAASSKRTQTGMMMGTPAYMAPEQALGRWPQVDGRTDLWSVGAIFYSLLSGRPVHEGQTDNEVMIRAATRPAPSLARAVPSAPLDVVRLVDRALQFEQSARYPDAASMRVAVRALMAAAGVQPWGGAATAPVESGASAVAAPVPSARMPVSTGAAPASRVPAVAATAVGMPARAGEAMRQVPAPVGAAFDAALSHHATLPHGPPPSMAAAPFAQGGSATVLAEEPAAPPGPGQVTRVRAIQQRPDDAPVAADYATDEDIAAMRELFTEVERALIARTQYGESHPEARRRADRAFRVCASALMHSEYGLVWNVTPYAFTAREEILWEPQAPLDRIPYQLFADGVRLLGLLGGVDELEFQTFFRLLTLDRATEVAPEDDFATLLWDSGFEHVVHQVIDTFADGDQQKRLKFEQDRERVMQQARADTAPQLAQCWQERQAGPVAADVGGKHRRILARLTTGPTDAEALARAADLQVAAGDGAAAVDGSVLHVDAALRTMLAARLTMETGSLSERFAIAAARAFEEGLPRDGATSVTTPFRYAIDGLSRENPELSIDMVGALCREVGRFGDAGEAERLRALLAAAIVSPKMLESVLAGVKSPGANHTVYARGLRMILGYCDATYFSVVLGQLGAMPDAELRDVLVDYLARNGAGHEVELGKLFKEADIEVGLSLVRVLAATRTSVAREAIAQAAHSPHPVVRIEALGHVEGVSSERLRLELRTLLEDREAGVRIAALKAMEQYSIRVAGPFLVLRVKSAVFDDLSLDERRQALQTLSVLAPSRAESVAIDVVKDRRLVTTGAHEESRELAVELLGRLGVTEDARATLMELSTARFRNSDRVRAASAKALEAFTARAEQSARAATAKVPAPAPGKAPRA